MDFFSAQVLSLVLSLLPKAQLCKCRGVCRRWTKARVSCGYLKFGQGEEPRLETLLPSSVREVELERPVELQVLRRLRQVEMLHVRSNVPLDGLSDIWPDLRLLFVSHKPDPNVELELELSLEWCRGFEHLEQVVLCGVPLVGLEPLADTRIRSLNLGVTTVTKEQAAVLPRLTSLTDLNLSYNPNLDDDTMRSLATLIHLRELDLTNLERLSDEGVAALGTLPALQHLTLSRTLITGSTLDRLRSLTWLWLAGCQHVGHELRLPPKLEELCLHGCVNVSRVSGARFVPSLRELDVVSCQDLTLEFLRTLDLPRLQTVRVGHGQVTRYLSQNSRTCVCL
jgi:hypothetical protein